MFSKKRTVTQEITAALPKNFHDEIAAFIKYENMRRGPYGIDITVEKVEKGRVLLSVSVVDHEGKLMWSPSDPVWMGANGTVHLTNILQAFNFTLSAR